MPETEELVQLLEELRSIPTPKPADPFMALMERTAAEARALRESLVPNIHVAAPDVVVQTVPAAEVRVDVPDQSAALAALASLIEGLTSALLAKEFQVTVNVPKQPAPVVNVELPAEREGVKTIEVSRDRNGLIKSATVTEA